MSEPVPEKVLPSRTARGAAWVALTVAGASTVNALVTAAIVNARDYQRFAPVGDYPDPHHDAVRAGIEGLTALSCVGAFVAFVIAVAARRLERQPGTLPCKPIANGALCLSVLATMIAIGASIVCGWQLAPWPFG